MGGDRQSASTGWGERRKMGEGEEVAGKDGGERGEVRGREMRERDQKQLCNNHI